jgi:hypothetical protein
MRDCSAKSSKLARKDRMPATIDFLEIVKTCSSLKIKLRLMLPGGKMIMSHTNPQCSIPMCNKLINDEFIKYKSIAHLNILFSVSITD